ncbi:hypothetical protein P5673_009835 [Acropora cervicornis]|uniref:Uncharacterized protein n=1 Tax=Acropora cervicornis TaxID=6130 RepID=A0AAD9QSJ6_ACRCE|nr:hypothetical protein P5673_009835 [Acropora cervicornis]
MVRAHVGFQITRAHFLDFADLHLAADERPEDLFQRLMAFVEEALLLTTEEEELATTLENFIVLTGLKLIHPIWRDDGSLALTDEDKANVINSFFATFLEPRTDAPSVRKLTASQLWPQPTIVSSVVGKIGILSLTPEPRFLKGNELFCQVRAVYKPEAHNTTIQPPPMQATSTPDQNKTLSKCDPRSKRYQDIRANFM